MGVDDDRPQVDVGDGAFVVGDRDLVASMGVRPASGVAPPAGHNPAAVEAYLLFGERVSGLALLGIAVTALGVALVVVPPRKRGPDQAGSSPE